MSFPEEPVTEPAHPNVTSSESEAELRAALGRRTSGFQALATAVKLAGRTAAVGLPVVVLYSLVSGLVGYEVLQLAIGARDAEPAMIELWSQIAFGLGGFTALYGIVQFAKRHTVSRESWWPALFAVPLLLVGFGFMVIGSEQARQLGPVVLSLFLMAWSILWMSFGGAAASIVWIRSGHSALRGQPTDAGALFSEAGSRLVEVAGPHGARIHAQTIGMQLLLPGIFYALQLAFTDMIAVLDPERPALRRSGQLTFGMRGRLFRLMIVWWLFGTIVSMAIAMPLEGVTTLDLAIQKMQELFLDPSAPSRLTYLVQELIWTGLTWILQLALLVMYLEREEQVRAKKALKELTAGATG